MLGLDYIHWEDYYRDEYLPKYNVLKSKISNYEYSDELFKEFYEFFNTAYNLMKYYVWNNGEFYFDRRTILRKFFRQGHTSYGIEWMRILSMLDAIDKYSKQQILNYAVGEKFVIFDELKNHFEEMLNGNC